MRLSATHHRARHVPASARARRARARAARSGTDLRNRPRAARPALPRGTATAYRPCRAMPRRHLPPARPGQSPAGSSRANGQGPRPSGGGSPYASEVRSSPRLQSRRLTANSPRRLGWGGRTAFQGSRAGAKILIVDDESSMRFLLRATFELDGHDVDEAANGRVAAELLESDREYDLVSTDFMMPVMNGAELIDRIRKNPRTEGLPIILISA